MELMKDVASCGRYSMKRWVERLLFGFLMGHCSPVFLVSWASLMFIGMFKVTSHQHNKYFDSLGNPQPPFPLPPFPPSPFLSSPSLLPTPTPTLLLPPSLPSFPLPPSPFPPSPILPPPPPFPSPFPYSFPSPYVHLCCHYLLLYHTSLSARGMCCLPDTAWLKLKREMNASDD